jgi:hypothetical protein
MFDSFGVGWYSMIIDDSKYHLMTTNDHLMTTKDHLMTTNDHLMTTNFPASFKKYSHNCLVIRNEFLPLQPEFKG